MSGRRPRAPRVLASCVADGYASPNERILEVSGPGRRMGRPGGLLSVRALPSGELVVCVYSTTGPVSVSVEAGLEVYVGGRRVRRRSKS